MQISREILVLSGGLQDLPRASVSELLSVPGVGEARACALIAVSEIARRQSTSAARPGDQIVNGNDVFRFLQRHVSHLEYEVFMVIALDAKHRLKAIAQTAQGSATSVEVHPREVFSPLIRESAAFGIVAHNHPSGDPEPSQSDYDLTDRLLQAGYTIGIPILDHVVIGGCQFVSLAERGYL